MKAPQFLRLAQIDRQHFITACRHGLIHLTWGRVTTRLSRSEFRRLAGLLEQVGGASSPASIRGGRLRVTYRRDDDCEVQIESLILLLSPGRFLELVHATQDGIRRLDEILSSGVWDEDDTQDAAPDIPGSIGRTPFSKN